MANTRHGSAGGPGPGSDVGPQVTVKLDDWGELLYAKDVADPWKLFNNLYPSTGAWPLWLNLPKHTYLPDPAFRVIPIRFGPLDFHKDLYAIGLVKAPAKDVLKFFSSEVPSDFSPSRVAEKGDINSKYDMAQVFRKASGKKWFNIDVYDGADRHGWTLINISYIQN